MKLFKNRAKYEFKVLGMNEKYVNKKADELQNEGWELAGDCSTKYFGDSTNSTFIYIPFKRKIKT